MRSWFIFALLSSFVVLGGCVDEPEQNGDDFGQCAPGEYRIGNTCGTCNADLNGFACAPLDGPFRNGACVADACVECGTFTCKGVAGCSDDVMFAHNGDGAGICPDGCYSACAL